MTTGGPTGPAENREDIDVSQNPQDTSVEQTRYIGKQCRSLMQQPDMQEKIQEYLQKRISEEELKKHFQRSLFGLQDGVKRTMGLESDTLQAMQQFLTTTGCFNDIFLYEINHNKAIKESAREQMMEACVESADADFELTDENKKALKTYLEKESDTALVNFLETHRARKIVTKRAIKAAQYPTEKSLELSDFDSIHNKIANLDPTRGDTKRIQSAWNTLLGGFNLKPGEDVQAAFARIRENGTEGDLSADYQVLFGPTNTCMSETDKNTILSYLVGCLTPTVSYHEIVALDAKAAKTIIGAVPDVSDVTSVTDPERKQAIIQYRKDSAQSLHTHAYTTSRLATKKLDRDLQIKILGTIGSKRRVQSLKEFGSGRPGSLSTSGVVDFEKSFLHTYQFNPDDIMTDGALTEKLQTSLGNRIKNIEKFGKGNVMMWRKKGTNGQRDMVGYYTITSTQGESEDDPGEIQVRFLGNNTSIDPNNPYEKGRLTPGGIVKTFNGPQFFDYLMGSGDDVMIDFVEGFNEDNSEHPNLKEQLEKDQVRFYSEKEVHAELRSRSDVTEICTLDALNEELDNLLYQDSNKSRESDKIEQRNVFPGMIFACQSPEEGKCDTFQVEDIIPGEDGQPGKICIWDGWGSGEDARREMTFLEFINVVKNWQKNDTYSAISRIPGGKPNKDMSIEQFNMLMSSKAHNSEGGYKNNKNVCIQDGKLVQLDATGTPIEKTIIQVGGEKDLHIIGVHGDMVEVSQGTFKQAKYDEKKGKAQDATFKGTTPRQISLTLLWSYLQNNSGYKLEKPLSEVKLPEKKDDKKQMSWFNIFAHSHSLGVLLHGDLWKAPFKAWEEQHHKDHAFHGKLTAALAIEKMQNGKSGPIGSMLNWAEWPSLMVADSNNSFQSYVDELVNKIGDMGSAHRTKLIKKWARSEHFPSAKFMAALFASMTEFGQLYPYDDGADDPRNKDHHGHPIKGWFWYNSIAHSLGHKNYPHMPPHEGEEWPEDCRNKDTGEPLSEIEACYKLFNSFKSHPILTNLGRRFQKYMNKGHDNLVDGGKGNMEQRVGMEARLEWMMTSILSNKPTEMFGAATDIWLTEGYPTEYSTMPYMAMMIGQREQQLLPKTQTHAKDLFQSGNHVPMLVFCQNKALGDTFRETSIAFAYTISNEVGEELEALCKMSSQRLNGDTNKEFRRRFESFWKKNGKVMMHKLTGMRDPMLNLMINAPETFDEMLEAMPEGQKKKDYQKLKDRRRSIQGYFDRLQNTYDSPSHTEMPRGKAFYTGDHFRFRDSFDVGYPMAWVNWDAYWDSNMDKNYAAGGGATDGDGIFNEIRGFLYAIPKMAEKMAKDMGFEGQQEKDFINKISNQLYHKNIEPMQRLAEQKIKATNPDAEYCSMTAQMFGLIPVQEFSMPGSGAEAQARYKDYYNKIEAIKKKADEMQKSGRVADAIKYRENMAKRWSKIVKQQIKVSECSIEDIENDRFGKSGSSVRTVTSETLEEFETKMRPQGSPMNQGNAHSRNEKSQLPPIV